MGGSYKRYSVYLREGEMPVAVFATAEECATVMGCTIGAFHSYLSKQRKGKQYPKKYCIYEDEVSKEDVENFRKNRKQKLTDTDLRILSLLLAGLSQTEVDKRMGYHIGNTHQHCKKILRATGLDPRRFPELAQLKTILQIEPEGV